MFAFITTDLIIQVWVFSENLSRDQIVCLSTMFSFVREHSIAWLSGLMAGHISWLIGNKKKIHVQRRTKRTS